MVKINLLKSIMIFLVLLTNTFLQAQPAVVKGIVRDGEGKGVPYASVVVKKDDSVTKGSYTNLEGNYKISGLDTGSYRLIVTCFGYKAQEKFIRLKKEQVLEFNFTMKDEVQEMKEVVIKGKSTKDQKEESGYEVDIIETKPLKNLTTDINQLLKATSGINIRESGGLGSGFKLSLNGLSGNQIRYFIDGIPMENFGSSLSLNNFPINLVERIEVYKGVVPVTLGADALGGAINIVTSHKRKSFIDAANSYGSFNTHRASLIGQYRNQAKGYFARLSSFFNHSDNNYLMDSVPVFDLKLGNNSGSISTRRFYDQYTSGMGRMELGLLDKKYADQLSLSFTAAHNKKNYQHPDNTLNRAFGAFHTTNQTLLASVTYKKNFEKLDIKANLIRGNIVTSTVDTSTLKYNWAGESIIREHDDPKGELFERRSLLRLTDNILNSNISLRYHLGKCHDFDVSFNQNSLKRGGEDKINEFNLAFESPNFINKNIAGIEYSYQSKNEKLVTSVFGKQYWYNGKIITQDYLDNEITTYPVFDKTGYGASTSFKFVKNLLAKFSFEQAYRVPETFEILGDGIYVKPNPDLQPEQSLNMNLGTRFNKKSKIVSAVAELNYFYRNSKDFIRYNPLGPFGNYENISNVRTTGIEGSLNVEFKERVSLTTNITYQDITDQTEFDEGLSNTNYQSRIPNVPYLFGNLRIGVKPLNSKQRNLSIYWHTRYVHEFFLTWENLGDPSNKYIIPGQLLHDLEFDYSIKDGKYNVSCSALNLTNALAYDNFNIQKPGRAIYVKLRYFLTK